MSQLNKQKTWKINVRENVPFGKKVLIGTWALKFKILPDGTTSEYKVKFCVRDNLQIKGVDYSEIFAPVVQWSIIRLGLTMILSHG